jgi:hypothetical protein
MIGHVQVLAPNRNANWTSESGNQVTIKGVSAGGVVRANSAGSHGDARPSCRTCGHSAAEKGAGYLRSRVRDAVLKRIAQGSLARVREVKRRPLLGREFSG